MEKRFYYVSIGYCGRLLRTPGNQKYGYGDKVIPVRCTEDEIETVATAVGKGYLADSCTVSLTMRRIARGSMKAKYMKQQ